MDSKKIVAIACILLITVFVFLFSTSLENFSNETAKNHVLHAVIIDQLYHDVPNDYFDKTASNHLKKLGYAVDVYTIWCQLTC